uniref:Uncharacterized protein n=1 Tax=Coccidioides posadasii RMSCC 3488 TaxID=454284 RepID=A0A0J6FC92_COCPO|nr:hypothetical protein CPAG_03241 [Coccidioides posadasii RMSCC 3488]
MGHATVGAQIFSGCTPQIPLDWRTNLASGAQGASGKSIEIIERASKANCSIELRCSIIRLYPYPECFRPLIWSPCADCLRQGSWAKMLAFLSCMKPEVEPTSPTSISEWNPLLHSSTPIDIGMKNQSRTYHKVEYHIFHRTSSCRSLSPLPQKINWPKRKFSYANDIFILRSNLTIDRTYPELTKSLALPSSLFRSLD